MDAQGRSQNSVGVEVGTTSAGISLVLGGEQQSSKLVEPISELLGIPLPPLDSTEPEVQELAELLADLDPDSREILRAMAEKLKSSK